MAESPPPAASLPPGVYHGSKASEATSTLPYLEGTQSTEKVPLSVWGSKHPKYRFPTETRKQSLASDTIRQIFDPMNKPHNRNGSAVGGPTGRGTGRTLQENEEVLRYATRATVAEKALKQMQLEVDELRRREIQQRQQKEELRVINQKLSEELEALGGTLLEQTRTLKVLSGQIQRQDPCQLVRSRRGSLAESRGIATPAASNTVAPAAEVVVPPAIDKEEEDVDRETLEAQNTELLRLVNALDQFHSPPNETERIHQVELSVLSCQLHLTGTALADLRDRLLPQVTVSGPYSPQHTLLETAAPSSPTLHPVYDQQRTIRWSALESSECAFLWFTVSSSSDCGQQTRVIGKSRISIKALLSASLRETKISTKHISSLHNLTVRTDQGEDVGLVYIEVKLVTPEEDPSDEDGGRSPVVAGVPRRSLLPTAHPSRGEVEIPVECFIQVMSATALLERSPGVPSNPYVVVLDRRGRGAKEIFRTAVCEANSKAPRWEAAHVVYETIHSSEWQTGDLVFQLFDSLGDSTEDDFLGEGVVKKRTVLQRQTGHPLVVRLQPREEEPVPYISKFKDNLGTLQVRLFQLSRTMTCHETRCPTALEDAERPLFGGGSLPVESNIPLPRPPTPTPSPAAATVVTPGGVVPPAVPLLPTPTLPSSPPPAVASVMPQPPPNAKIYIKEVRNLSLENEGEEVEEAFASLLGSTAVQVRLETSSHKNIFLTPAGSRPKPAWDRGEGEVSTRIEEYDIVYFVVMLEGTPVASTQITADEFFLSEGEKRLPLEREGHGCGRLYIELELLKV